MRTTIDLDDELVKKAQTFTKIQGKTALLHAGLEALIQREAALRLAALGGTEPNVRRIPRRRPSR